MIYKCVFPFGLEEYLCHRKAETRALWEVWLWWKTNCSPFIFLVANEPLCAMQLFFPILLIRDTCLLYICLIIRYTHQYVWSFLFTLFLCNLKDKPLFRDSVYDKTHWNLNWVRKKISVPGLSSSMLCILGLKAYNERSYLDDLITLKVYPPLYFVFNFTMIGAKTIINYHY